LAKSKPEHSLQLAATAADLVRRLGLRVLLAFRAPTPNGCAEQWWFFDFADERP